MNYAACWRSAKNPRPDHGVSKMTRICMSARCVFAADYQRGNAGEFIVEAKEHFAAVLRELFEAREALRCLLNACDEPAGLTEEIIRDKTRFSDVLAAVESRVEAAKEKARAALSEESRRG